MAEKKYYWLKLKKDFFKRHDIKIIEAMPNGKDYILFYLKMLVESLDHDGNLRFNETIPYNENMLSVITGTNVDVVRNAMKVFRELSLIEVCDNDTIYMREVNKMIGSEGWSAERVRKFRKKGENALLGNTTVTSRNVELELEKELEKELELEVKETNFLTFFNFNDFDELTLKTTIQHLIRYYCKEEPNDQTINNICKLISSSQVDKKESCNAIHGIFKEYQTFEPKKRNIGYLFTMMKGKINDLSILHREEQAKKAKVIEANFSREILLNKEPISEGEESVSDVIKGILKTKKATK